MKVSGVCGAANLYRQSAMSFNLYFQALLCAALSQADGMTAQQVEAPPTLDDITSLINRSDQIRATEAIVSDYMPEHPREHRAHHYL